MSVQLFADSGTLHSFNLPFIKEMKEMRSSNQTLHFLHLSIDSEGMKGRNGGFAEGNAQKITRWSERAKLCTLSLLNLSERERAKKCRNWLR